MIDEKDLRRFSREVILRQLQTMRRKEGKVLPPQSL